MLLKEFIAMMSRFSKAIPKFAPDFSDSETSSIWFKALGDIPDDNFRKALSSLMAKSDDFPSIARIRKEAMGKRTNPRLAGKETAELIWGTMSMGKYISESVLLKSVGEVGVKVIQRCGGWTRLCENTTDYDRRGCIGQWAALAEAEFERNDEARSPFDSLPPSLEKKLLS